MAEQIEVNIKGELVSCDKLANGAIGGGFISLEECRECNFHKGTETIREPDDKQGYMKIIDVICALPRRMRVTYYLGGINGTK